MVYVYVVELNNEWEGTEVVGVSSSPEIAADLVLELGGKIADMTAFLKEAQEGFASSTGYPNYHVSSYEVDKRPS